MTRPQINLAKIEKIRIIKDPRAGFEVKKHVFVSGKEWNLNRN